MTNTILIKKESIKILKKIEKSLGILQATDWNQITSYRDIQNICIDKNIKLSISLEFNKKDNLLNLLKICYPNYQWIPWKYSKFSNSIEWDDLKNRNLFLRNVETICKISKINEWYSTPALEVRKHSYPISKYYTSTPHMINDLKPDITWFPWQFSYSPKGIWESPQNQQLFKNQLEKELNIQNFQDWYCIKTESIIQYNANFYLKYNSVFDMLKSIYPNKIWLPWKFSKVGKGSWEGIKGDYNLRQYLSDISNSKYQNDFKNWYSVDVKDFAKNSFLKKFNSSLLRCLSVIYPEIIWVPWKFCQVPNGYWDSISNQRYFLSELQKELEIKDLDGWYRIPSNKISFLYKYYHSTLEMFQTVFPNHPWEDWKFLNNPRNITDDISQKRLIQGRDYLSNICHKLKIQETNQLYSLQQHKFLSFAESTILQKFESSVQCLFTIFPEVNWLPWKFSHVPHGYWKSKENQKFYFKLLEKDLNIKKLEDWYNVDSRNIGPIYQQYGTTLNLLQNIYPNYLWLPWKFLTVSKNCWNGLKGKHNRRQHFNNISNLLKIKICNDWYNLKYEDIFKHGGVTILKIYDTNLNSFFSDLYPELIWLPWKFSKIHFNFWEKDENILEFLNWCESYLKIKSKEDWHFVTYETIRNFGATSLLQKWGGVANLISHYFPKENWDKKKLISPGKTQIQVSKQIQNLFPKEKVHFIFKHPNLVFKNTTKKIEFDIFVPSLNLAFEYQGIHHYKWSFFDGDPTEQQKRDKEKKEICNNNSITLIEIPYTWDGTKETLIELIQTSRPDILL